MSAMTLEQRLDRVESVHAIEQLAIRYALAVDGRDVDAWLALFPADVDCGRHGRGRDVLRTIIEPQLRTFYRSIHLICGHRIELRDSESAQGIVYCRAEHEVGDRWIVMAIAYGDDYVRRDGSWYFARRRERHWYGLDVLDRPAPPFHRWPDDGGEPTLPGAFPTWAAFWDQKGDAGHLTASPVEARS